MFSHAQCGVLEVQFDQTSGSDGRLVSQFNP